MSALESASPTADAEHCAVCRKLTMQHVVSPSMCSKPGQTLVTGRSEPEAVQSNSGGGEPEVIDRSESLDPCLDSQALGSNPIHN